MDLFEEITERLATTRPFLALGREQLQQIAGEAAAVAQPALDAKDTEIERLHRFTEATYEVIAERAEQAEAERDRLKAAIARVKALCAELMTIDPADLTRAQRRQIIASVGRAVLATLDQPGDQEGTT